MERAVSPGLRVLATMLEEDHIPICAPPRLPAPRKTGPSPAAGTVPSDAVALFRADECANYVSTAAAA
jgi:hypothetical protein